MRPDETPITTADSISRRRVMSRIGGTLAVAAGVAWTDGSPVAAQEASPAATPAVPPDFKVVLHAAEEQNWQYVLSNLKNLTQEWPRAHLRVVVDGSAVLNLQGDNVITNELARVAAAGVELQVCPNALREHEIDPATIPSYAQVSLGGVVALVLAHQEGFVYVKP
jgi:intracellular sulfur oxidation DsrE/DsrF family protein